MNEQHITWRAVPKVGTRNRTMQIINDLGGLICECDYIDNAKLIAAAPALLALARKYASECAECNGTTGILVSQGKDDMEFGECHECADIHKVIREATGEA